VAGASAEEVRQAELALARSEAQKAKVEAELPYLLGKQPIRNEVLLKGPVQFDPQGHLYLAFDERFVLHASETATGDRADQVRKALDTPIKLDATGFPLKKLLDSLEQKAPGVHFVLASRAAREYADPVTLQLGERIPLAAVLQALEDD